MPSQPRVRTIGRVLIDDAPTLDLCGELLDGRYRVRERLGFGGAGVVFLADDLLVPKRPVAIKVSRSRGEHEEQRFSDEIEVLGALHHPNLIVPLAWGRTPSGHLYLVMEYLRGQTLRARLELGPLTLRECLVLGTEAGEALLALHAAGVLHRDVKPGNIILLETRDTLRLKLIDLGVAKRAAELWPSNSTRFETATNAAPGTPPYLPPEAGRVSPDPSFDVYGLGATLFEAATGRPHTLGASLSDLPVGLREIVVAALALDANARPTLAAMVAELIRLRDADSPGQLLQGRYELLQPIGRGAKAEVWRAAQRLTGRDVVVKRLHARATEDDAIRLRHEGQVLAALDHPAFPTLLDAWGAEGRLHLVLTVARGDQALKFTKDPLSPAQVCRVGIELLQGLLALHQLGVLHRDLHAGNVMIDFEGPRGRPVVTILDLGMCELLPAWWARHMRYATPPERRAQLGSARQETLDWSAPETMSAGWTEKSDVWSVALLLYRLLTGRMPFAPKAKTTLTCPRQYRPDCPRELAQTLLAALHPAPNKRLDAEQLIEHLDDVLTVLDEEDLERLDEAVDVPPTLPTSAAPAACAEASAEPAAAPPAAHVEEAVEHPAVAASSVGTPAAARDEASAEPAAAPPSPAIASSAGTPAAARAESSAEPATAPVAPPSVAVASAGKPRTRGAATAAAATPAPARAVTRAVLAAGLALLLGLAIGRSLHGQPQADIGSQAANRGAQAPVPETIEAPLLGNTGTPLRERALPAAAEVLKAASAPLSRCTAGEALTLVAAVDASGVFTLREVFGPDSAAACVRAVLATLRAAPGPAQSITWEVP